MAWSRVMAARVIAKYGIVMPVNRSKVPMAGASAAILKHILGGGGPTPDRSTATVADELMIDTETHAFLQQIEDQIVDPQWMGDVIGRQRMLLCCLSGEPRDVAGPVLSRAKKERTDDYA